MPGMIDTWPALIAYECAFNTSASTAVPPYWVDLSTRTKFAWGLTRGRQYELDTVPAGEWRIPLENKDGALDPANTASPYYPNVVPYRPTRIRVMPGVNQLTVDQATCGQGTPYPTGILAPAIGVTNDFGLTVSLVASATAYTGSQVYQVTLPSTATTFTTVLMVPVVPVVPGQSYSATAQVRVVSGNSPQVNVALTYFAAGGTQLAATGGSSATITSGGTAWTPLTVSAAAPSGAAFAQYAALKVEITAPLSAATVIQVGGLQLEQSATATPFQVPQTVSQNLFPRVIATGTASMAATDSAANWWFVSAPNTSNALSQGQYLTASPTGQTVALAWQSPAGTTSATILYAGNWLAQNNTGPQQDNVQVTAGLQYTVAWFTSRLSSSDATVQVQAFIRWYNAAGVSLSTSHGTSVTTPVAPSWSSAVSVTATAPAGAVWARVGEQIMTPSSTTAQNTIYHSGYQFEQNSAATNWVDPGPTLYGFVGSIERWPQQWLFNGTYGQVQAIGVDAEAVIAQNTLLAPFVQEVLALGPNFFYQLNDPAGASTCVDSAGLRPAAPVEIAPFGPGSLTFGNSVTSNTAPGLFEGTPGPIATFANNSTDPGSTGQFNETFISLHKTTNIPGPPSTGTWTRIIHFNIPSAPGTGHSFAVWEALPATWSTSNSSAFDVGALVSGVLFVSLVGIGGSLYQYVGTSSVCDGNWHQVAVSCTSAGAVTVYFDGVSVGSGSFTLPISAIASDVIGASVQLGANIYRSGLIGSAALAIEYPMVLTQAQVTNLYQSWRNASAGESSGARAQRVLTWIDYQGPTAIDAGSTANMGPATDLTGATALDALNAIALTENGSFFVDSSGKVTLKSRGSRYNATTPVFVFGEQTQYGEWPYEAITFDYDPSHLFNSIQVTQQSTGQVAYAQDTASEATYYQRVLQRSTNQGLFTEAQDAATYLLQQYKSARLRISDLTLHPAAVPGLWLVCLQLELGTRIRVMRRPPAPASPIQFDGFVESISWDVDPDSGNTFVHLQCSPADLARYWTLGAVSTTLAAAASSGATSITINGLSDSATNVFASSISPTTQFTIDPGTAIAETVTPTSIPASSVGYKSVTVTVTTPLIHNHAVNAVVCEALPATYTDPTTWNAGTVLGPASCTFAASASSGATTISVTGLPDSKTNAAASNWMTGDLIWLSPGTSSFEGYNLLHPNVATAGEGALPLATGTDGNTVGVSSAYAGTVPATASATAYQGSNVWQASVSANAAAANRLIRVVKAAATPLVAFTWSVYVRSATTGANPSVHGEIQWLDSTGTVTATVTGASVVLTGSPSAAWTRITVSGTAPAGCVWASPAIRLDPTTPSSAWVFQADGLQWEASSAASTFQVCPQVLAVGASVPGYSSVTLTLNTPLANSHAAGDTVCDPLPPGTTSPAAIATTTRVAY